jgi:hypothetical protein
VRNATAPLRRSHPRHLPTVRQIETSTVLDSPRTLGQSIQKVGNARQILSLLLLLFFFTSLKMLQIMTHFYLGTLYFLEIYIFLE